MDENGMIERLIQLGLTRLEATIYLCLYSNSDLSGYEVAKQTGISRSNVYSALSGLVEKGAAYLIEGNTNKYTAVDISEFCDNCIRNMEESKKYLIDHIKKNRESSEGYITIEGYKHIFNKVINMLAGTEARVYLSASENFIEEIREYLQGILDKNMKLVLITDQTIKSFQNCQPIVYLTEKKEKQIRLIIDSKYVLTGEIAGNNDDTCLYSAQTNFVNVFKDALRNEIKLIELTKGEVE